MAENYKHLYHQMKKMVEQYQDVIVPGLRAASNKERVKVPEIVENLSKRAKYEALAEEALELAKEALKVERILAGESPTPVTLEEALMGVTDEAGDVWCCLAALEKDNPAELITLANPKMQRWAERLENESRG